MAVDWARQRITITSTSISMVAHTRSAVTAVHVNSLAKARQARSPSDSPELRVAARNFAASRACVSSNATTCRFSSAIAAFAASSATPRSCNRVSTSVRFTELIEAPLSSAGLSRWIASAKQQREHSGRVGHYHSRAALCPALVNKLLYEVTSLREKRSDDGLRPLDGLIARAEMQLSFCRCLDY